MTLRVGIEIGGTFTDLVAAGPDGVTVVKVPSTPRSPDQGAFASLVAAGIPPASIAELVHGSTVATNAVLERKGARLALLVTAGFRDLLELRRQDRERIFDIFYRKPASLVARQDVFEIPERVLADGSVLTALYTVSFADDLAAFLRSGRFDAVAICLLNAFAHPAHERAVAAMIHQQFPEMPVTCSVDVTREFREYERASTTTLSAYVQPVIDTYLGRIEAQLALREFRGHLSVMQSNGGRLPAAAMRRSAVTALLSGPAAGVTGAIRQAALSEHRNLITLDIGGTSADVCLVEGGRAELTRENKVDGLPVQMPMVDITTVGAGGGSIVWVDEGGKLRVGPRSAGADPGPACYGRGGTTPTLTDAQLLCGRIRPDAQLAGGMPLDAEASRACFAPLARRFNMSETELAESVVQIFVANVVAAIRLVSTRRGRDPRDYVLFPYGGAGPLHAAQVAEALEMDTVVVPPNAGVISAYGLLAADHALFDSLTRRTPVASGAADTVRATIAELADGLRAQARALEISGASRLEITLEMRFVGQAFELPVSLEPATLEVLDAPILQRSFVEQYEKIYRIGSSFADRPAEIVSYRVGLHVKQDSVPSLAAVRRSATPGREGWCNVIEGGHAVAARLTARARLGTAEAVAGPLVLEDDTATVWLPPGWRGALDAAGNLILRRNAA